MADVTKINGYIIKDANAPHPSNAGSAGQVLKKTETGTEWADDGESIPNVSAADNGKFLRVVNGAWAAATIENANGVSF